MEVVPGPLLIALFVSIVICIFMALIWCSICIQSEYRKVHRQGGGSCAVALESRLKGMVEWKKEDLLSSEARLAQFPCTLSCSSID